MFKIDKILLYHFPICHFSRFVRFLLNHIGIQYTLNVENFWEKRDKFLELNLTGKLPFTIIRYYNYEIDFINKKHNLISIFGMEPILNFVSSKVNLDFYDKTDDILNIERDKMIWFIVNQFSRNSIEIILKERIYNFYKKKDINFEKLSNARKNLKYYLEYFDNTIGKNGALIKNDKDLCDFLLGSFISSLDYLGEINWNSYNNLKNWYYGIKSRSSFKSILDDRIDHFKPSDNYSILDF